MLPVKRLFAGAPTVYAPQGTQANGWFTDSYSFHIYINCQSGVSTEFFMSGNLEGTNVYHFDAGSDGSLLLRLNNGGRQLLYSCGNPFAGDQSLVTYTVHKDTQNPAIAIASPGNGAQVGSSTVTISGSASDSTSGIASVTVNGRAAAVSGSSFSATIPLNVGANTVSAVARDTAGHSSSQVITVTRNAPGGPPMSPPSPIAARSGTSSQATQTAKNSTTNAADSPTTPATSPAAPAPSPAPAASHHAEPPQSSPWQRAAQAIPAAILAVAIIVLAMSVKPVPVSKPPVSRKKSGAKKRQGPKSS
jgi:hypothetical protein